MTEIEAKIIGSHQGIISVVVGLIIAQLIMTFYTTSDEGFIKAFFWFTTISYKLNIFIGAIIMLLCGHFYGKIAGTQIIIKREILFLLAFYVGWLYY